MKPKQDRTSYFNKMEGHEQKRELLMKKTKAPFPGSLILSTAKDRR
jgi:hypothetical protein